MHLKHFKKSVTQKTHKKFFCLHYSSVWLVTATELGFFFVKKINCFLHGVLKSRKKKSPLFN